MIHIAELTQPQVNKLRKLKPPHEFKNYKELCKYLGIEAKGGNFKKYTFKELERYVEFEKSGHKIIVTNINNERKRKQDERRERFRKTYGERMETLLLNQGTKAIENKSLIDHFGYIIHTEKLSNTENLVRRNLIVTSKQLMYMFGIINENYKEYVYKPEIVSQYLGINKRIVKDFFKQTYTHFDKIMIKAINNLESRRLAMHKKWRVIIRLNKDFTPATEDEASMIMRMEREVMDDMEIDHIGKAILMGKMQNVKEETVNRLIENEYIDDIESYYNAHMISFVDDVRNIEFDSDEFIIGIKEELNKIIQRELSKNNNIRISKQYTKIIEREADEESDYTDFIISEKYDESFEELKRLFINHDSESIVEELRRYEEALDLISRGENKKLQMLNKKYKQLDAIRKKAKNQHF